MTPLSALGILTPLKDTASSQEGASASLSLIGPRFAYNLTPDAAALGRRSEEKLRRYLEKVFF